MTGFLERPKGTLADAIAAHDFDAVAQWARYLNEYNRVCRAVEEVGYVRSGRRYESVWNVAARISREGGSGDQFDEVMARSETESPARRSPFRRGGHAAVRRR